jgi:hypothetical protein
VRVRLDGIMRSWLRALVHDPVRRRHADTDAEQWADHQGERAADLRHQLKQAGAEPEQRRLGLTAHPASCSLYVDQIVQTETDRRTATISPLTATEPAAIDAKTRGALDGSAAAFGFGPGMFNTLAANPTVLEIVMGVAGKHREAPRREETACRSRRLAVQRLSARPGLARISLFEPRRYVIRGD